MIQLYEVWQAQHRWGICDDQRPWLVIQVGSVVCRCFPISGNCYGGGCFEISNEHPDFPATGLTKHCFLHDTHILEIPVKNFIKRRGCFENELLTEALRHAGV